MGKESFYFQHDYNARNDDKILELRAKFGAEGYGIFWMILETMAENENGGAKAGLIGGLSLGYGVAKDRLLEVFNYCLEVGLFYEDAGYYYSKRLLTHKEFRKELSKNGAAGAAKRWRGYSPPNAKERKGKEIKGVSFNEEKNAVILSDGTIQKLGEGQLRRIFFNDLPAEEITKGYIV